MDTGNPYTDEVFPDYFRRTFDGNLKESDFYWHKDKRDRLILVESGEDWKLQMDNEIPVMLELNKVYPIPKETFHRIIKGKNSLVLLIREFPNL